MCIDKHEIHPSDIRSYLIRNDCNRSLPLKAGHFKTFTKLQINTLSLLPHNPTHAESALGLQTLRHDRSALNKCCSFGDD